MAKSWLEPVNEALVCVLYDKIATCKLSQSKKSGPELFCRVTSFLGSLNGRGQARETSIVYRITEQACLCFVVSCPDYFSGNETIGLVG